jgi:WD40 repeat protein
LSQVECIAFAPDGKHLFAGGSSGATQLWPVDPGGQLGTAVALYRHARAVRVLSPSTASPFVLSGGGDGMLAWQSYGRETANLRTLKGFERSVLAVHLPTEGFEALATDGRTLLRFDLRNAAELQSQPLARSGAHAAAFSGDGTQLAISTGHDLRVWDTASYRELQTLAQETVEIQWSVRFHPNGRWLISGGRGKAHVWDLETTRSLATIDLGGVLYIQVLAISPDGRLLAAIPSAAGQSLTVVRLPDATGSPPAN